MNKQNKKQTLRYKERFDGCQMEVGLDGIGEKKRVPFTRFIYCFNVYAE